MVSRRTSTMRFIRPMGWFGSHQLRRTVYCANVRVLTLIVP
jgi:hypothetical protein